MKIEVTINPTSFSVLEKDLVLLIFYENKFSKLCWVHVIFIIIAFDKPLNTKKFIIFIK